MAVKITEGGPQNPIPDREKPTRLLIVGLGLVGKRLLDLSIGDDNVSAVGHKEADVANIETLRRIVGEYPGETVVNCAAYTDVEASQKQKSLGKDSQAYKVNADGSRNMAIVCREFGKHLIQFSSDFVFPGTENDPGPYEEYHPVHPDSSALGFYAYTKAIGEQEALAQGAVVSLIRIAYPSKPGFGFFSKVVGWIRDGYSLFSDQKTTPTLIDDLVPVIKRVAETETTGIYHVASPEIVTMYDYGVAVAEELGLETDIKRGSLSEFMSKPGRTPKPIRGGLDVRQTERSIGQIFTGWRQQIKLLARA